MTPRVLHAELEARSDSDRATAPGTTDLRLSSEELAELTERIFETSYPAARGVEPGVPLSTCLQLFESQHVAQELVSAAVNDLVQRREQRLSNVLRRKADELERMLLGLLPRLDTSFHAQVRVAVPAESPGGRSAAEWVVYQIAAEKGELEVRTRHESARGTRQLFTVLVRAARPPGIGRRLLGRKQLQPREVVVLDPPGLHMEDLLAWTFDRLGEGPAPGRVVGVAFERLREAVLAEVDRAMSFVRDLDFEG